MPSRGVLNLARSIKKAGKEIANDEINKIYYLEPQVKDSITVESDSGFEAIVIGNTGRAGSGYMYLYFKNTPVRNSFPSSAAIAKLLKQVIRKERLEIGEGKAAYYDWSEFGSLESQMEYFSKIVSRMAGEFTTSSGNPSREVI